MADDNSYRANQDVIAGARAIRGNPAALAQLVALLNPPPSAPPRADPAGALATSRSSVPNMSDAMAGSAMMPGGGPLGSAPSTSSVRALTNALASAPMPPLRPTDVYAINALSPTYGSPGDRSDGREGWVRCSCGLLAVTLNVPCRFARQRRSGGADQETWTDCLTTTFAPTWTRS